MKNKQPGLKKENDSATGTDPARADRTGTGRSYHSPSRQRQADDTRRRILDAAGRLLSERGFANMTMAAIAAKAGVATPTVYAAFRSKRGILAELLDHNLSLPAFRELCEKIVTTQDPREMLRMMVRLTRMIYESEPRLTMDQLRGAGVIDPDLWKLIMEREQMRRVHQQPLIAGLHARGQLRPDLTQDRALDILWALTGRPFYGMLCISRGWDGQEYEAGLYGMLEHALLPPPDAPAPSKR